MRTTKTISFSAGKTTLAATWAINDLQAPVWTPFFAPRTVEGKKSVKVSQSQPNPDELGKVERSSQELGFTGME
jgi:hypothetical protein